MQPECNPSDWLINMNIKDIHQAIERVYRIKNIYDSIIDKLWIPKKPIQFLDECAEDRLDILKWLFKISIMLNNLDELLGSSINDLSYIEDSL